jgi:LacI family transcriptional regulator
VSRTKKDREGKSTVTLQTIARHVGLAPCSISAVLNDSPAARKIPQRTKNRVVRAAMKLNYRPNFSARALRTRRTHLVAAVASDLSSAAAARVISGIERSLREDGYLLVLGGAEIPSDMSAMARVLRAGVEGVIMIDGAVEEPMVVPVIHLSTCDRAGHWLTEGLTELGAKAARAIVLNIENGDGGSPEETGARARSPVQALVRARVGAA